MKMTFKFVLGNSQWNRLHRCRINNVQGLFKHGLSIVLFVLLLTTNAFAHQLPPNYERKRGLLVSNGFLLTNSSEKEDKAMVDSNSANKSKHRADIDINEENKLQKLHEAIVIRTRRLIQRQAPTEPQFPIIDSDILDFINLKQQHRFFYEAKRKESAASPHHHRNIRSLITYTDLIRPTSDMMHTPSVSPHHFRTTRSIHYKGGTRTIRMLYHNSSNTQQGEEGYSRLIRTEEIHLNRQIRKTRKKTSRQKRDGASVSQNLIKRNFTNKRCVRLRSDTGYFLEVRANPRKKGKFEVFGTHTFTKNSEFALESITARLRRIRSKSTGRYIAIDGQSNVVTRRDTDFDTYFTEEHLENGKFAFSSVAYSKPNKKKFWYLALKHKHRNDGSRNLLLGKTKRASRTLPNEQATHFTRYMIDTNLC